MVKAPSSETYQKPPESSPTSKEDSKPVQNISFSLHWGLMQLCNTTL